jgi:periplasmic divalent cation tolerance protein
MEPLLVISNLPDRESARQLARAVVEARLAACVNVLAECESVYRWRGELESASEVPVFIKTTRARYGELEAFIRARHPYELPEIVAVPLATGLPAYLDWLRAETAA